MLCLGRRLDECCCDDPMWCRPAELWLRIDLVVVVVVMVWWYGAEVPSSIGEGSVSTEAMGQAMGLFP